MSLLILHRNPLEPFPYHEWLARYDGPVVILADRAKLQHFGEEVPARHGYTRLEALADYEAEVVPRALALAAEYRFTRLIAHFEGDVDMAASLREQLGLAGAWTADVLPFRDKALMKLRAMAAGIEVAPHTVPRTAGDVWEFAAEHGYPVVLKNRAGLNAIGLRILRDADELAECLAEKYAAGFRDDLLAEAFVPGRMCHVDGLVVDGRTVLAWPSQYQYDLASFGSDPGARVDLTLDPGDPLTARLLTLTDRVLAALKTPGSRLREHAFHAEIFHTPDDRLVLCEIAARPGGAKIREVFHTMFGMHLGDVTTRAQAGVGVPELADTLRGGPRPAPRRMSGQMLTMKRPWLVRSVPGAPAEPWVTGFWLYARPGQVIAPAGGSADFLTAVVGSAATRAECERRLRRLGDRFLAQIDIAAAS